MLSHLKAYDHHKISIFILLAVPAWQPANKNKRRTKQNMKDHQRPATRSLHPSPFSLPVTLLLRKAYKGTGFPQAAPNIFPLDQLLQNLQQLVIEKRPERPTTKSPLLHKTILPPFKSLYSSFIYPLHLHIYHNRKPHVTSKTQKGERSIADEKHRKPLTSEKKKTSWFPSSSFFFPIHHFLLHPP